MVISWGIDSIDVVCFSCFVLTKKDIYGIIKLKGVCKLSEKYDFNNMSEGQAMLAQGYVDYAIEVITDRALQDLRDGLKPVQRRILYMAHKDKVTKSTKKCAGIVGDVMSKFHPHGDSSIYQAMVLMTDSNGSCAFPLLHGQGTFGGFYKTDPPAAMRYTEVMLSDMSAEMFGEMDGIEMKPNFDVTTTEPEVLPVSFPIVLVNASTGIAVGFHSNMPTFNFNDVIDLTMEYIKNGECTTVIEPDFVNGCYYVKNNKELMKLMRTGTAKLKFRGRVRIEGKEITITEFPPCKTLQGLKKQIDKLDLRDIVSTGDFDDHSGVGLWVNCRNKNVVNDVLYTLYKETDLQSTFSADMTVLKNGEPVREGVWDIVADWVEWRREVLRKQYESQLAVSKEALKDAIAFLEIVKYPEKRSKLREILDNEGEEPAVKFILENYDNEIVTPELARWVIKQGANNFRNGGKFKKQYDGAKGAIEELEEGLRDIDKVILKQLAELKTKYGNRMKRKTEVTLKDYAFTDSAEVEKVKKDESTCYYEFKNGFLKKMQYPSSDSFEGKANSTLIAVDNRGRVLRVYCEDIPYTSDLGTYLPRYFNLDEADDYKIKYIGVLDGSTKMLIYKDGNIGFLDTSEWVGLNRQVKVIEKGISVAVADKLGVVLDDIPEMLFVTDTKGKIGYEMVDSIKRKDRTAKTRVFNLTKGAELDSYYGCPMEEGMFMINNIGDYRAPRLATIPNFEEDFKGDVENFIDM